MKHSLLKFRVAIFSLSLRIDFHLFSVKFRSRKFGGKKRGHRKLCVRTIHILSCEEKKDVNHYNRRDDWQRHVANRCARDAHGMRNVRNYSPEKQ